MDDGADDDDEAEAGPSKKRKACHLYLGFFLCHLLIVAIPFPNSQAPAAKEKPAAKKAKAAAKPKKKSKEVIEDDEDEIDDE